ncbi:MAG: response regulator, partial [Proteobacteria bacterium]|nr:response regulator [Pseudomonadota bacterium]
RLAFEQLVGEVGADLLLAKERPWGDSTLSRVAQFLKADRAALFELSPDQGELTVFEEWTAEGVPSPPSRISTRFPHVFRALKREEVVQVERGDALFQGAPAESEYMRREGIQRLIVLPLSSDHDLLGAMSYAFLRATDPVPPEQVARLAVVGQMLANALARRRAVAQLRRSDVKRRELAGRLIVAQEEERRRLARELHDDITQRLAALAMEAVQGERLLADGPSPARTLLHDLAGRLRDSSAAVQTLSRQLHPSILRDLGLVKSLRAWCREFEAKTGIPVAFDENEVPARLPGDVSLALYRIAQEAMQNAAKHARPDSLVVRLSGADGALHLRIADDGAGVRRRGGHQEGRPWAAEHDRANEARGGPPGTGDGSRERNGDSGSRASGSGGGVMRPTILIADDHRIFSEGLTKLLEPEFEVVGRVEDGEALLRRVAKLTPDAILLDIGMPRLNGLKALRQLKQQGVTARVVILTMHDDPAYAAEAIQEGASGFVLKSGNPEDLLRALREALRGNVCVPPTMTRDVFRLMSSEGARSGEHRVTLTPRQIEVLERLAKGRIAKEIADELGISQRTVEYHKYKMMSDLRLENTAELIQYAVREGYVIS